jgi:hypothetical protein
MPRLTASRNTTRHRPRGYIANYRPQAKTRALLADMQDVLEEYRAYWPLTDRQIYYRLVGVYDYPKTELCYERVQTHLSNARRGRVIPFTAIRDDGIAVMAPGHFADTDDFYGQVQQLGATYHRDKLARQPTYLKVWCEAAGMAPQLARVAHPYSIPVYSCGGFDSTTAKYEVAQRICRLGRRAVILHFGDYDVSGVSMFTAIAEDVAAFVAADKPHGLCSVEFRRVALTAAQVDVFRLPTAPAKEQQGRGKHWQGGTCQLEALAPDLIARLADEAIRAEIDLRVYGEDVRLEQLERQQIAYALPAPPPPPRASAASLAVRKLQPVAPVTQARQRHARSAGECRRRHDGLPGNTAPRPGEAAQLAVAVCEATGSCASPDNRAASPRLRRRRGAISRCTSRGSAYPASCARRRLTTASIPQVWIAPHASKMCVVPSASSATSCALGV